MNTTRKQSADAVAQLLFVLFVGATDGNKQVSPADIELLQDMFTYRDWAGCDLTRAGLARLQVDYPTYWRDYESGEMRAGERALVECLQAVADASADAALADASAPAPHSAENSFGPAFRDDLALFLERFDNAQASSLSRLSLLGHAPPTAKRSASWATMIHAWFDASQQEASLAAAPSLDTPGAAGSHASRPRGGRDEAGGHGSGGDAPRRPARGPGSIAHAAGAPAQREGGTRGVAGGDAATARSWRDAGELAVAFDRPHWGRRALTLTCLGVVQETGDTKTYLFDSDDAGRFDYWPGQFIALEVDVGGTTLRRTYTLSSSPSRPWRIAVTVKRVPKGWLSNWLFDNMQPGMQCAASGPYGEFHIARSGNRKLLMLAAGSGMTPIMSMLRWMHDMVDTRDVVLVNNVKTPDDVIFEAELRHLAREMPQWRIAVVPSLLRAGDAYFGPVGRLDEALIRTMAPDMDERDVFCCGPAPYMRTVNAILDQAGMPAAQRFEEQFGDSGEPTGTGQARTLVTVGTAGVAAAAVLEAGAHGETAPRPPRAREVVSAALDTRRAVAGAAPKTAAPGTRAPVNPATSAAPACIVFERSMTEITCQDGASILETAEAHGIAISSACRVGLCGTCRVRSLEGEVSMPANTALSAQDQADGFVLTCVGRVSGRVVLDH